MLIEYSALDEVLKLVERNYFMQKTSLPSTELKKHK